MLKFKRQLFFSNLLTKLAATKSKDLDALRTIFISKYPGERAAAGLAVQYYNKFIKISDPNTTLEEGNLNPPLPPTFEELKKLIQEATESKSKTKIEELSEKIKEKHSNVNLSNLSEDYLSWIHLRYVEDKKKPEEIIHPLEEALVTLKKFPSIQNKYNNSPEFKEKVNQAGYPNLSSIKNLTLDQMEEIIALDTSELTVKVEGVELKPEEFLGKFGEWNLWLPHTKETSVKIAGYDKNYNPKTTWCTARTKGSNLFYNYIGRKDVPSFLFYIIKDDPKVDRDWLSLGYISSGARLIPDFRGINGGLSVDRANTGLKEENYAAVLKEQWIPIRSRIDLEIERHKISENGKERYVSPGRAIIESLAKDITEFKKEFKPKSNAEKKDFMDIILDAEPSDEVKKEIFPVMARLDSFRFLMDFSEQELAQPYLGMARKSAAEKYPSDFLDSFSEKDWAGPYLETAAKSCAEKYSISFLNRFSGKNWAGPYLGIAAGPYVERDPIGFLHFFSEEDWAGPYLGIAAKSVAEKDPINFLDRFSGKDWAGPYLEIAAKPYIEQYPMSFLNNFSEKDWVGPYLEMVRKHAAEKDPIRFLKNFSEKDWAGPYLETAAKSAAEQDRIGFLDKFSKKDWVGPYLWIVAKSAAEKDPIRFLYNFSEEDWVRPYLEMARKSAAEQSPVSFLYNFSEEDWAGFYLEIAVKSAAEQDPIDFLDRFSERDWAGPYLGIAAKSYAEKEPINFLKQFPEKDWAGPYLETAVKPAAEQDPIRFLHKFSEEDWAGPYLGIVAKSAAEKDPIRFLNDFSEKDWAEPYLGIAAKFYAEKDPIRFLNLFSEEDWVGPYLEMAAKSAAEEDSINFLHYFLEKDWVGPYLEMAVKSAVKKNPIYFLDYFSGKDWAGAYLETARKSAPEEDPITFLYYFSKKDWAQIKRPELGDRSYVDLAEEKKKEMEKISSYHPKLLKLAKILNQLGGDSFKSEILDLKNLIKN